MIEESLVVSDTNIFFDLLDVNLLDAFFRLPCEITTSDFVIREILRSEQAKAVNEFIRYGRLDVVSFNPEEFKGVMELFEKSGNNTSITDCSVWYHAKRTGGRLLTGDAKLRKSAVADSVKVSGILYILDNLVEYGIADEITCADRLEQLMKKNQRLPVHECEKRIGDWRRRL